MMGSRDREADQLLVKKDRHAKGDVRPVRGTPVGVVVHDDVAWADRFAAPLELFSDASDISGNWTRLERRTHLALAKLASLSVRQRGAKILGLPDDAGIGHTHQLVTHLDRNVFKRAENDRSRHRIDASRTLRLGGHRRMNSHCSPPSLMTIFPVQSTRAVAPGGTSVVLSVCRMTAGPGKVSSTGSSLRR